MLNRSKIETARERLATLCQWRKWADELNERTVRKVMNCKRPLLSNKLATEVWDGHKIFILFEESCNGLKLVGEVPATGVFKIQPKVGGTSETELMMQSKFLRPAIIGKTNSAAKHEHEAELYDITVKEASEKGWLHGPLEF